MSTGRARARRRSRRASGRRRRSARGRACRGCSPSPAARRGCRGRSPRAAAGRAPARASASAPPACAQPGSRLASSVAPAPYGYWSKVTSISAAALSISSSSGSISSSPASDFRCERCSGAPERRATSIISPTAVEQPGALVADVRHERRAERRRLLGERDELVGLGVGAGDVDEPEREHPRARLEPEPDLAPHLGELLGRRSDPVAAEHELAHRAVPDRRDEADRRPASPRAHRGTRRRSSTATRRARRPRAPAGRPAARPAARRDRRRREPVRVDHLGREALQDLRRQQRVRRTTRAPSARAGR